MEGILELIKSNPFKFQAYVEDDAKDSSFFHMMPCDLSERLNLFEKLLMVRTLKPERLVEGI